MTCSETVGHMAICHRHGTWFVFISRVVDDQLTSPWRHTYAPNNLVLIIRARHLLTGSQLISTKELGQMLDINKTRLNALHSKRNKLHHLTERDSRLTHYFARQAANTDDRRGDRNRRLSHCKARYTLPVYTARTYGPWCTGRIYGCPFGHPYIRAVYMGRTYSQYIRVVCTGLKCASLINGSENENKLRG